MSAPRRGTVACRSSTGTHRISYRTWGEDDAPRTVLCVHGLTGNAHDFDDLAPALVRDRYRVVCPDLVGRGESDWLADPESYGLRQYVADMSHLLAQLDLGSVDWVGTSLGGLIGMALASQPGSRVRRLVLNDIGPFVPTAALRRLASYLGTDPTFADLHQAEAWLRDVRAPLGTLPDAAWRRITEQAVRAREEGGLRLHYDPAIAVPYRRTADRDLDVWSMWDEVTCPVLVLRGERSDLLLGGTAREMATRGPRAEVVEIAGCGHPPSLLVPDQIAVVTRWLADHHFSISSRGAAISEPT